MKETPGNPKYPNTFISIESNEQKVGAYLGYNDVVDIRKLALSWPALKAFRCFNKIAKHLNKMTAFRLLYDNESVFTDVDYQREWKILEDDSTSQVRDKKARHLAAILLQMEKDFGLMQEISQKDNRKLQSFHIGAIRRELPGGENFPLVDYKRLEGERSNETLLPVVAMPVLGPYATETRLESINRCWNLLKYFRYCHQAGLWPSRFTMEGVCQRIIIDASHIPEWLRPPDNIPERPDELAKTPAVEAADRLEARDYRIVWDLDIPFNGKAQLDEILQAAKASNIQIPSTDQKLSEDPRLSASAASFRDSIRRQFNCQRLSINIRTLELQYTNLALSQSRLHRDILRDDWVDTQSTFADSANSEFVVHVQFEALDDPEEGIYESFQPPPAIAAFFDTSSGEVRSNAVSVAQIAAAAFDDKDKQLEAAESSPTNNLPTFLELAFGHGGSACDIGAPPDPKKKFPKQSQHHALLRYYDGIDVTDKEGRRKWQRRTLEALTMNAQVASVKLDKLPNSLTKEQSLAIQEAQFIGERMAMARESDDGSGEVSVLAGWKVLFMLTPIASCRSQPTLMNNDTILCRQRSPVRSRGLDHQSICAFNYLTARYFQTGRLDRDS